MLSQVSSLRGPETLQHVRPEPSHCQQILSQPVSTKCCRRLHLDKKAAVCTSTATCVRCSNGNVLWFFSSSTTSFVLQKSDLLFKISFLVQRNLTLVQAVQKDPFLPYAPGEQQLLPVAPTSLSLKPFLLVSHQITCHVPQQESAPCMDHKHPCLPAEAEPN